MAIKVPRAPPPTSAGASAAMRGNRKTGTRPEMIVRRVVHGLGARYRLHDGRLPGRPDLVLPRRRLVIFVHGCFWHAHDPNTCPLRRRPPLEGAYWRAKIARNVERDDEHRARLAADGWRVELVWECETRDPEALRRRLARVLAATTPSPASR
jgi:DNA mismatch endonuclease (patch repair protein)